MKPVVKSTFVTLTMVLGVVAFLVLNHPTIYGDDSFSSRYSQEQRTCLQEKLGDRYGQVAQSGEFTVDDKLKIGPCFGYSSEQKSEPNRLEPSPADQKPPANYFANLPEGERHCLVEGLGEVRFKELEAGAAFTEADKSAMASSGCFGKRTEFGSERIEPVKTNPFEGMHESMATCMKDALGEERFEQMKNGGGVTADDKQLIEKTGCFKGGPPEGERGHGGLERNPEMENCLKETLGEERFNQMKGSGEKPTPGEFQKIEAKGCFAKDKNFVSKRVEEGQRISDSEEKCVRLALGADHFEDLKKGIAVWTEDDRAKAEGCMGKARDQFAEGPEVGLPDDLKNCLAKAMGEDRFNEIKGGQEPTEEERSKGEACFKTKDQKTKAKTVKTDELLPPAPEIVPLLRKDPNAVRVDNVSVKDGKVIIDGKTLEGTDKVVVDIYMYSDPIQATASADTNGHWTLSYDGTLPQGDHHVYAVIKKGTANVRSDAKDFNNNDLAQTNALTTSAQTVASPSGESPPDVITSENLEIPKATIHIVYAAGLALIASIAGFFVYLGFKKRAIKPPDQSPPPS